MATDALEKREPADAAGAVALVADPDQHQFLTLAAVAAARERDVMEGCVLLTRAEVRKDRLGRDYLAARFMDCEGRSIEGRKWQYTAGVGESLETGQVYSVTAAVDAYQGVRQLRITNMRHLPDADRARFTRATTRRLTDLTARYDEIVSGLQPQWAALVRATLSNDVFEQFCTWPASSRHHGAVRHGLFTHSLLTAEIASLLPRPYQATSLPHDRDLVIAACLLHDVGKVFTLPSLPGAANGVESSLFDHVTLGVLLVREAANRATPKLSKECLDALLNAILTHHGRKEWGAPMEPGTVEGWLVHLADYGESRLWQWSGEEEGLTPRHSPGAAEEESNEA